MQEVKMSRRDLTKFVEEKEILEKREKEGDFSFFIDDVTEDLKHK